MHVKINQRGNGGNRIHHPSSQPSPHCTILDGSSEGKSHTCPSLQRKHRHTVLNILLRMCDKRNISRPHSVDSLSSLLCERSMGPQTLMVPDVLGLGSLVKFPDSVFGIAVFEHFDICTRKLLHVRLTLRIIYGLKWAKHCNVQRLGQVTGMRRQNK